MIKRIRLSNFKAHADLELADLPVITVLVGRNNTGKSSILHAAALPKHGPSFSAAVPIGEPRHVVRTGADKSHVEITFDNPAVTWSASFGPGNSWSGHRWSGKVPYSDKLRQSMFYLSAIRQPVPHFNYSEFVRDVGPQGEQTWNILHQLKAMDDPRFAEVLDWSKKFGMGISTLGTPTVNPGIGEIAPESYGHKGNLILHGSGTWAVLPIITQGILCEPSETLLIEEPEIHLHRESIDSLWTFLGYCAEREVQTICATHSIDFLASMSIRLEEGAIPKDSAIFLLRRDDKGKTAAEKKDAAIFRNIRTVIKKELAGVGL